jgi:hypothetical protein
MYVPYAIARHPVQLIHDDPRFPRHPRLIGPALVAAFCEVPQIVRLRRMLRPRALLLTWILDGQAS